MSISRFTQIIFGKFTFVLLQRFVSRLRVHCQAYNIDRVQFERLKNFYSNCFTLNFRDVFVFLPFYAFWLLSLSWFSLNVCCRYFSISASFLSIIFSLFSFIFAPNSAKLFCNCFASFNFDAVYVYVIPFYIPSDNIFYYGLIFFLLLLLFFLNLSMVHRMLLLLYYVCLCQFFLMSRFLAAAMFAFDCHFPKIVSAWWTFIDFHVI